MGRPCFNTEKAKRRVTPGLVPEPCSCPHGQDGIMVVEPVPGSPGQQLLWSTADVEPQTPTPRMCFQSNVSRAAPADTGSTGGHGFISQPLHDWAFPREPCGPSTPAAAVALSAQPADSFLCFRHSTPPPDISSSNVVLSALELSTGSGAALSTAAPVARTGGFIRMPWDALPGANRDRDSSGTPSRKLQTQVHPGAGPGG